MSEHKATISWTRTSESFRYEDYNREHQWVTGSGVRIQASAAPAFLGNGLCADPEEAFVAAVASCHMLTFLAICARKRWVVDRYEDQAVGFLKHNEQGKLAVTRVELRPVIEFAADSPDPEALHRVHELSHEECFIANSVTTDIVVIPA